MAEEREDQKGEARDEVIQTTRRGLLQGAGLAAAMAMLGGVSAPAFAAEGSPFPSHKKWKIVFVNHVTTNPFFVPTQYGIEDACGLLGMDYQWTGSAPSDAGGMVRALNSAVG